MAYTAIDKTGATHKSNAKTVKTHAQIVHFTDGTARAYWFKSYQAAHDDMIGCMSNPRIEEIEIVKVEAA